MSCRDCGEKTQAQCDCCKLVDGDETFKECVWCETCGAWICKNCDTDWLKRIQAYFKNKFGS